MSGKKVISSPVSNVIDSVLKILKEEGYILNYSKLSESKKFDRFDIHLKYYLCNPVITEIMVISKPGRRVYCAADKIPVVKNGLGMVLISTSRGVFPDHVAKSYNVGGEILLKVF